MEGWNPKKATKQGRNYTTMLLGITIPTSLCISPNPPLTTVPYMQCQPYCNTSQHMMFSHTSTVSHYNLIICHSNMQCALNTAHTTSSHYCNPHLPCSAAVNNCNCLKCRQPHTYYRFTKLVNAKIPLSRETP